MQLIDVDLYYPVMKIINPNDTREFTFLYTLFTNPKTIRSWSVWVHLVDCPK